MATILHVHQDGVLSGSAISLALLLKALDRSRFQSRVLLAREGPARRLFEPVATQVDVVPTPGFWTCPGPPFYHPDFYRNFRALLPNRELEDFMRLARPDLVHINDKAMLAAGIAASRAGLPVVWHLRSAYAGGRARFHAWVSRQVIQRCADLAIAISEDEVENFDRRLPVEIIYNSVDMDEVDEATTTREATRQALGLLPDETAIGMVGLLNETKGAWDFIRAAGMVKRRFPELKVRFVIVAPYPPPFSTVGWSWRGRLARRLGMVNDRDPVDQAGHLAQQCGIERELLITGRRADVLHVLAALDIVSVCYRMFAIGRPAFEAMAVGRPVIVNQGHSGRSTVVQDGQTGLVVPRADPAALAASLGRLLEDRVLGRRLGQAGALYARRHMDANANARRVEVIYERLLAAAPASRRRRGAAVGQRGGVSNG